MNRSAVTPGIASGRSYTIRQLCAEFDTTPRALRFYEDKGLLNPGRNGLNRIYSARDRGRLQLILRGKRVGFPLAEIGEMLDLYDVDEVHAVQMAASVAKFRRRIVELEAQRVDIELSIESLREACAATEARLEQLRPDLLPQADDYHQVLRAGLEGQVRRSA